MNDQKAKTDLTSPGLPATAWLTARYRSPLAGRGKVLLPQILLLATPVILALAYLWKSPGVEGVEIFSVMVRSYYVQFAIGVVMLGIGLGGFPVEESTGAMVLLLTKPISRAGILSGRILSAFITGGIMVLISVVSSGLILKAPANEIVSSLTGILVAVMFYGTLFTVLPLITTRSTIIGLIYMLVWESFVSMIPGTVNSLTASQYLRALLPDTGPTLPQGAFFGLWSAPSTTTAFLRLGIAWIAIIAVGIILLRKKEYSIARSRVEGEA